MRIRHFWYHAAAARRRQSRVASFGARVGARCDAMGTIAKLSGIPQPDLGWFARAIAFLTTPFKFLGISGWSDTGCTGEGRGRLVRDARHSTDGFWTIDVALEGFAVGDIDAPYDRFLRVECEPGTEAHRVCATQEPAAEQVVWFSGPLVVDTDGPFLESHPDDHFQVVETVASHKVESRRSMKIVEGRRSNVESRKKEIVEG